MSSNWLDWVRSACTETHSQKVYPLGEWKRGTREEFGVVVLGDGRAQIRARCSSCGLVSTPLPGDIITRWSLTIADFTWVKTNEPIQYEPCSVKGCGKTPTDRHHFAPYNTFGRDADSWPVMPLCRDHHREWHSRMNGYIWNRKSAA